MKDISNMYKLSSPFRRHFRNIEELILESLAWKKGSILYDKLKEVNSVTPPPDPGCATPMKQKIASFRVYESPAKPVYNSKVTASPRSKQQSHSINVNIFSHVSQFNFYSSSFEKCINLFLSVSMICVHYSQKFRKKELNKLGQ
jgi:hypothetical protein